ncbi:MAG: CoA ester lyase [Sphingobium sp.]|uniref:HpcH/HpaI aldolase/citrate lyase family protein n=1 Tax=Sphingobium sp. TaxID=1912891 RepID=UPI0029A4F69B|nr:CoA ester lyase [Sphingobium sp.]MDX3910084.1 CoA ester lyase [Sphingobium sp.]
MTIDLPRIRSALYLPASNPRGLTKARTLPVDMLILDLEDAVRHEDKEAARKAAVSAVAEGFGDKIVSIRVNALGTPWHDDDVAAVRHAQVPLAVLPKATTADATSKVIEALGKPVFAMIETIPGIRQALEIAAVPGVAGLIAGTNDIAVELKLPADADRRGLTLALQTIVLAARSSGAIVLDGVYNRLDDPDGLWEEAREGRAMGFDGKTLIHPNQIEPTNRAFAPDAAEIEYARAMVEAATGGAERFRGRMVETMHVAAARRLLQEVEQRK